MFINFTNHPSTKWMATQIEAAQQMGGGMQIVDMQFPTISPYWTTTHLENESMEWVKTILDTYPKTTVIHVMGELGFVHAFINTCRRRTTKILLVHSTTHRKESGEFEFVRFREYC